jgi:hypothetical protein
MTAINYDSKGKAPFQHPVQLSLTLPTLTSSIITLLFLGRFNKTATHIGSLAAGFAGQILRLDARHYEKQKKPLQFFFRCTPLPLKESHSPSH